MRHFYIYKKTNAIHVLINLSKGKFYVVGEKELEKRTQKVFLSASNSEVLYLRNFNQFHLKQIKDVRPIFKYNENDLQVADININGNSLKKSGLNNEN